MSDTIETAESDTLHLAIQPVGDLYLDDFDEDDTTPALAIRNGCSHVYVVTGDVRAFAQRLNVEVAAYFGDDLTTRVFDALMAAGHRALADEYADTNGAGR